MSTENDRAVLNSIFNPLLPTSDILYQDIPEELVDDEDDTNRPDITESKKLEIEGVTAAEAGRLDEAVSKFTQAAGVAPQRASPYNNRAQALRMKGDILGALKDLDKGLELCSGKNKIGCLLLCQRGIVYRAQGNPEKAKEDFTAASNLGSAFAKQQLVQMNPYAAMCNQMLKQMMSKVSGDENVTNNRV